MFKFPLSVLLLSISANVFSASISVVPSLSIDERAYLDKIGCTALAPEGAYTFNSIWGVGMVSFTNPTTVKPGIGGSNLAGRILGGYRVWGIAAVMDKSEPVAKEISKEFNRSGTYSVQNCIAVEVPDALAKDSKSKLTIYFDTLRKKGKVTVPYHGVVWIEDEEGSPDFAEITRLESP